MSQLDRNYWLGRWARGETGWHQTEPEPRLIEHFAALPTTRVLVPLCGRSLDLGYLASRGHDVIGVEWSELACRAFFDEAGRAPSVTREGSFTVFREGGVTIYQGDFFEFTPALAGKLGAIYDRAALIALPPELRPRYAKHLSGFAHSAAPGNFRVLQIVLQRTPTDPGGPPFSVTPEELETLYGKEFVIEALSRERIEMGEDPRLTEECVYRFSKRGSSAQ
jgi:thiopurine S-methyltransferase